MQLTVDIQYEQLLSIIRHLPPNQIAKIKNDLANTTPTVSVETASSDFKEFLLKGPVMSDEQYNLYKETRKSLNKWRNK